MRQSVKKRILPRDCAGADIFASQGEKKSVGLPAFFFLRIREGSSMRYNIPIYESVYVFYFGLTSRAQEVGGGKNSFSKTQLHIFPFRLYMSHRDSGLWNSRMHKDRRSFATGRNEAILSAAKLPNVLVARSEDQLYLYLRCK